MIEVACVPINLSFTDPKVVASLDCALSGVILALWSCDASVPLSAYAGLGTLKGSTHALMLV